MNIIDDTVEFRVRISKILGGGSTKVYSVWTPSHPFASFKGHSTITRFEGDHRWWGRVGTDRLPEWLDKMPPGTDDRIVAVSMWRANIEEIAYSLIILAHPEAVDGRRSMGEIEVKG